MPEPDPHGVEPNENWPRGMLVYKWACGNWKHRQERARRIMWNARHGEWLCRWCGELMPLWRRADAVYCCEGCRKRAGRARRYSRESQHTWCPSREASLAFCAVDCRLRWQRTDPV